MENRIKKLRENIEVTQKQLADILAVNVKTLHAYETQKCSIPDYVLCKLSDYFKCSIDFILCRTSIKYRDPKTTKLLDDLIVLINESKKFI